jgi:hypothetical protein
MVKALSFSTIQSRVPHSGKTSDKPTTVAVTYVVEKGKPLVSPA